MHYQFELLKKTRKNILAVVEELTLEQLNHIPDQFNNSIGWQIGHLVVTQQLLHYRLSNLPTYIDEDMVNNFKKESTGKYILKQNELETLIKLFTTLPQQLETDYTAATVFKSYTTYKTSYTITLQTIEEAIAFNTTHEAMHLGIITAMKKQLIKKDQHIILNK